MAQPYIGEIRIFAGNFPPAGWAFCDGQPLPISENDALFTLIGTTYGGDGQQSFNLPDLRGRVPVHQGQLAGGSQYIIGQLAGVEAVTLSQQQLPVHTHPLTATTTDGDATTPAGNVPATTTTISPYRNAAPDAQMNANAIQPVGGSQPHENMQSFLGLNFIISLFGIFPTQN